MTLNPCPKRYRLGNKRCILGMLIALLSTSQANRKLPNSSLCINLGLKVSTHINPQKNIPLLYAGSCIDEVSCRLAGATTGFGGAKEGGRHNTLHVQQRKLIKILQACNCIRATLLFSIGTARTVYGFNYWHAQSGAAT